MPAASPPVARLLRRPPSVRSLASQVLQLAPSWRSLAVGLALVALASGMYVFARESSVFAVRAIDVRGAPPALARDVRAALAPLGGESLLKVDSEDVRRHLGGVPTIAAASFDRAFPHTLRVFVRAERPVAVLRIGAEAWLVSATGRVIRDLPRPGLSSLPRVWLPRSASVTEEAMLSDQQGMRAVAALAELRAAPLGQRVRDVVTREGAIVFLLPSGLELRLGDASKLRLKLTVARRILPLLSAPGYLDVTVPERAVAADESQVSS